ncbi:MAG: hypothetical protein AAFX50_11210, partial [Acidobacteriota bacterium]
MVVFCRFFCLLLAALPMTLPLHAQTTPFLYWAEVETGRILESRLSGGVPVRVAETWRVVAVVADFDAARLYWYEQTDRSPKDARIFAADLNAQNRQLIWTGQGRVDDLELDVAGQRLYWTNQDSGTLERVGTDGSNHEVLLSGLVDPEGLGLDPGAGFLYFLSGGDSQFLYRAELDGANPTSLASVARNAADVEVDVDNDHLYLGANSSLIGVTRRDLDGQNPVTII